MKWGDFKEEVEKQGINDESEIFGINWMDDDDVTVVEHNKGEFVIE